MKNMKRIRESRLLRQYYMKKFASETGNTKSAYHGIFVTWDAEENKYCLRGESLPAHPDLKEKYPNGWSMLDWITEVQANKILGLVPAPKTEPKKRILAVRIKHMVDECPDTSYYGEYSARPTSEFSIDRAHTLDCASVSYEARKVQTMLTRVSDHILAWRNEFEMDSPEDFTLNEAMSVVLDKAEEVVECDCGERGDMQRNEYQFFNPSNNYEGCTPEEVRKYVLQDYKRMQDYNRERWYYLGIRAEAEVMYPAYGGVPPLKPSVIECKETVSSMGLWGIESDSDKSYFAEVAQEELAGLKSELLKLGFSKRAIATAFKSIEEVSE